MATVKEIKRKSNASNRLDVKRAARSGFCWFEIYEERRRRNLESCRTSGGGSGSRRPFDRRAQAWLDAAPDDLKERSQCAGLVEFRRVPTLDEI